MKKILCLLFISLFFINISIAQNSDEEPPYRIVQEMPEFMGGEEAMFDFIDKNLRYPNELINSNKNYVVYIQFIVEKDGSLSNIELGFKDSNVPEECVEEAINVVRLMPNWMPGIQNEILVRVTYVIPIEFK